MNDEDKIYPSPSLYFNVIVENLILIRWPQARYLSIVSPRMYQKALEIATEAVNKMEDFRPFEIMPTNTGGSE